MTQKFRCVTQCVLLLFFAVTSQADEVPHPSAFPGIYSGTDETTPPARFLTTDEGELQATRVITLESAENVRFLKGGVLEVATRLPSGTKLRVPFETPPIAIPYRDSQGNVQRSSNGFYRDVVILEVEPENRAAFPQELLERLNLTPGGLYLTSSVVSEVVGETIPPLRTAPASADFLLNFREDGKPLAHFTGSFQKRFGSRLNRAVNPEALSAADRAKWSAVYAELRRAVDRKVTTDASLLFVDQALARDFSILFENQGVVQTGGAWTIAVKATAPRHEFANVPCAEFVSELIRQAYWRAGYDHREDFRPENPLFWDYSAAVVNLTDALDKAGWIPWDSAVYQPMTGAPVMHFLAKTPGHAYLAAGDSGRIIVDNGSPQGRDLRKSTDKVIKLMYLSGVFFLPPGILPEPWASHL